MPDLILVFIIFILISFSIFLYIKFKLKREELKAVYEAVNSLVIQLDRTGNYISINSSDDYLLAKSREQLLGKNLKDTFDKEKAHFFQEALNRCFEKKELVEIEYPLITQTGKKHWFTARIAYKNDNIAVFNAIDVTEKVGREQKLVESERKLKRSNEVKDKFFSIIAHDLRSPISTFKSLLEFFSDEFDHMSEDSKKEVIHSLHETSDRMNILLDNLLNWSLSQSESLNVEPIDYPLSELGTYVEKNYQKEAEIKNVLLKNEVDPMVCVKTDKNLLEAIIRNLISNAIKYTDRAGTVSVRSEMVPGGEVNKVRLIVEDTGVGMNEDQLKNLFSLKKSFSMPGTANEQGTGLGLVLCKEFAEKLGTTLSVKTDPGAGTQFSFELQACES